MSSFEWVGGVEVGIPAEGAVSWETLVNSLPGPAKESIYRSFTGLPGWAYLDEWERQHGLPKVSPEDRAHLLSMFEGLGELVRANLVKTAQLFPKVGKQEFALVEADGVATAFHE